MLSVCNDDADLYNRCPAICEAQSTGGGCEVVAEDLPVSAPCVLRIGCLNFDLERLSVEQQVTDFLRDVRGPSILVGRANKDDVPAQHVPMPGLRNEEPPKECCTSVDWQSLDFAVLVREQRHRGLPDSHSFDVAADGHLEIAQIFNLLQAKRLVLVVGE